MSVWSQETVIIRALSETDAAAYFRLRVQSEQEYPEFVGFSAERELAAGINGMCKLLAEYPSEGTQVIGAFAEQQELVGVVALSRRLSPKYQHKMFLWGMYVAPEFRGGAVAHGLMDAALRYAKSHQEILSLWLQVTVSNVRGQQFYKRYGFDVFGTEQRSLYAAGAYHGVHYMELELKAAAQQAVQEDGPAFGGSSP